MLTNKHANWRRQVYLVGAMAGTFFGLLAAYLFARASDEADTEGEGPTRVQTGQLIAMSLAALSLIRQIAEAGKGKKK